MSQATPLLFRSWKKIVIWFFKFYFIVQLAYKLNKIIFGKRRKWAFYSIQVYQKWIFLFLITSPQSWFWDFCPKQPHSPLYNFVNILYRLHCDIEKVVLHAIDDPSVQYVNSCLFNIVIISGLISVPMSWIPDPLVSWHITLKCWL